jgi:hypothetical protein
VGRAAGGDPDRERYQERVGCGWREPPSHLQIEFDEDHIAIWTTVPFSPAADSAAGAASEARLAYNDANGVGATATYRNPSLGTKAATVRA